MLLCCLVVACGVTAEPCLMGLFARMEQEVAAYLLAFIPSWIGNKEERSLTCWLDCFLPCTLLLHVPSTDTHRLVRARLGPEVGGARLEAWAEQWSWQ